MNESVRAVFLTPSGFVLLMKISGWRGDLWITPGGRIQAGESHLSDPLRALANRYDPGRPQEMSTCLSDRLKLVPLVDLADSVSFVVRW